MFLLDWHMQNVMDLQILTPIFIYIENIFKKFVRFFEKSY